jgi:carboxymethylenebutenolidase
MSAETLSIATPDGTFNAYARGKGPAIIVIQEIFGINQVMRDICDDLAASGYRAICPDLFWRIEPGIELTDKTDAEWKQAFDLFGKFDPDKGVEDIAATIAHARSEGAPKVGAMGFCLGGLLAYLTACRTDCDASTGYYGVGIQDRLEEAGKITRPLLLHIAGKDQFVPPEAQDAIMDGLKSNPQVALYRYPERDHAFARVGGAHFHREDAETANNRTMAFFEKNLG